MNVNFLLYDDFDTMDLAGLCAVFGKLPGEFHLNYLSMNGDIINSMQGVKIWTEPLQPEMLDGIFVIPGGRGARRLIHHEEIIIDTLKKCVGKTDACLMVSNASGILAQTGLLYHRNVASCSTDENWRRMFTAAISWIPDASWVADGKFYSCKNSLSSLDMALGLVADFLDVDVAARVADELEYVWEPDESGYY